MLSLRLVDGRGKLDLDHGHGAVFGLRRAQHGGEVLAEGVPLTPGRVSERGVEAGGSEGQGLSETYQPSASKTQGSRMPGYVADCGPAAFRVTRLARRGTDSSRLLHGCYTQTPSPSALWCCPKPQAQWPVSWSLETA